MKRVFFLFGTIICVLVALGLAAVVVVYFWAVRDLPGFTRIADYRPALTTTVLARDGSVIGSFYRENRFLISLDQTRRTAATLALLTVPRSLFPRCFYYEESKKQRHREFALCRCMLYTLYKNLTCYLLFCPVGVNGRRHTLPERS